MPVDFSDLLIPTFPAINDVPVAPTASKAGNGSHLIKSYNELVTRLNTVPTSEWQEIEGQYIAKDKDRLAFINSSSENINIVLPLNPVVGFSVTVFLGVEYPSIYLHPVNRIFNLDASDIYLTTPFAIIELFYVNAVYGWACTNKQTLTINPPVTP